MLFSSAVNRLRRALAEPLPGAAAQDLLAPVPRREWPAGFDRASVRHAAGLLLIYPVDDRATILLTVRAHALRHGGQVSLPGGVVEPDETFEQAAHREAHEEVGLDIGAVTTLGALTPVDIAVSGFRLHPIVAAADLQPLLRPSDGEVARILQIGVETLMDPVVLGHRTMLRDGRSLRAPAFLVDGEEVWGATAMALAEFLTLLGWPGPDSGRSR